MKKIKVPTEDGIVIVYTKDIHTDEQLKILQEALKDVFEGDSKYIAVPYEYIKKVRFLPRKKK